VKHIRHLIYKKKKPFNQKALDNIDILLGNQKPSDYVGSSPSNLGKVSNFDNSFVIPCISYIKGTSRKVLVISYIKPIKVVMV